MTKLTDTQLVILSAAAKRDDGAVLPPPKSLKARGGALTGTLKTLLKKGLVAEQPAMPDTPSWRETEDGSRVSLSITDAGLQVIVVDSGEAASGRDKKSEPPRKGRQDRPAGGKTARAPHQAKKASSPVAVRPGTKQALLIDLLKRKRGATIEDAVEATGWQPHSVRGAISGTLKKKLGLTVTSETVEGRGRVYRIAQGR